MDFGNTVTLYVIFSYGGFDMSDEDVKNRHRYLGEEVENSIRFLITALRELQLISNNNGHYFTAFQLTSVGIERLLKSIICYGYFNKYNKFPSLNNIKSHDLKELKDRVEQKYFSVDRPALVKDLKFLKNNKDLNELLYLLSEFGKYSRYHNLNIVVGAKDNSIDVEQKWREYENKFVMNNPDLKDKLIKENNSSYVKKQVFHHIIYIFEKFIRALVRQFTLGDLGREAQRYLGYISHFLFLKDSDLGETDYINKKMY